jgi:hypothetical protein
MRSPITCCLSSPLNPLMLRLIRVSSCSSSSWLTSLICLWYRVFDSQGFLSFSRSEEFDSYCPPYFCWCEVPTSFISVSPVLFPPSIPSSFPLPTSFGGCVCSFCVPSSILDYFSFVSSCFSVVLPELYLWGYRIFVAVCLLSGVNSSGS